MQYAPIVGICSAIFVLAKLFIKIREIQLHETELPKAQFLSSDFGENSENIESQVTTVYRRNIQSNENQVKILIFNQAGAVIPDNSQFCNISISLPDSYSDHYDNTHKNHTTSNAQCVIFGGGGKLFPNSSFHLQSGFLKMSNFGLQNGHLRSFLGRITLFKVVFGSKDVILGHFWSAKVNCDHI